MIELQHLTKRFATQGGTVVALNDINLTIRDGDVYGIIGMSGAGKSTLVRCINMLERPDEGNVIVNGKQMQDLRAADLRAARREITMIFQQFNLLMQRTCLRNIMFPMELAKVPKDKAEARAVSCWSWSVCPIRPMPTRRSCPAARSSALRLPVHWQRTRRCCSATRRRAPWTRTRPTPFCSSFKKSTASWASQSSSSPTR